MLITFSPTGQVVEIGGSTGVVPQYTAGLGAATLPVYETPSGTTAVQTELSSGNPYAILAGNTGYFLRFIQQDQNIKIAEFKLEDSAALTLAQTTIETALGTDEAAITIDVDGSLVS